MAGQEIDVPDRVENLGARMVRSDDRKDHRGGDGRGREGRRHHG